MINNNGIIIVDKNLISITRGTETKKKYIHQPEYGCAKIEKFLNFRDVKIL